MANVLVVRCLIEWQIACIVCIGIHSGFVADYSSKQESGTRKVTAFHCVFLWTSLIVIGIGAPALT